jgi:hypothetical protein
MAFNVSDDDVTLKHSTTDATQERDLSAANIELGSRGNWF